MKTVSILGLAAMAAISATPATASVVTLNFDGVANDDMTQVDGFYNGGTSGAGNVGIDYGIAFTPNAWALNIYNGMSEPNPGIALFIPGGTTAINYAAGFDTGFSFVYASMMIGTVKVYDGLDGTGNLLATIDLANNYSSSCGYCRWDEAGASFAGIAKSVDFTGGADFVAYDNMTFGRAPASAVPGAVPEPATWAMMIGGFTMIGGSLRYRRRRTSVTFA